MADERSLPLVDQLVRPIRDLRISVTDRCNFRCRYCMPREAFGPDHAFLPRSEILTFEEITRVARTFVELGVTKVRMTGGEPMLRAELPKLVAMLAGLGAEVALTTNASKLETLAKPLAAAGLARVTVSLDSLDDATFRAMTDADIPVARVLDGIAAAQAAGLEPVKVNCVVKRGLNDHTLLDLARHFRGSGVVVRFIEFMDVGITNGWRLDDVVSGREIVQAIDTEIPIEPIGPTYSGEVAKRWRYRDGSGEIGVITSVTEPFCGGCHRARLSAEGTLYTCLFGAEGTDLRALLRGGASDDELRGHIEKVWRARSDRYSEVRSENTRQLRRVEMSYIGG